MEKCRRIRGNSVCQRIGYILDCESPRKHASSIVARKALRWKRIFLWMDQWSKTTSHWKRDSDSLQHRNVVLLVVPGVSNSSSGSDSSTSRTLSRQGRHCSTSSSSSSSSPPVSEIQTREREDRIESDISPVTVSTTVDERSGRPDIDQANTNPKPNKKGTQDVTGRPVVCRLRSCKLWNRGVAARIQRKFGGWRNSSTWRLSLQFFSWRIFRVHTQETWGYG